MNRWQHFRASLVSRVDWMVSQVENHEALAESAIRDLQRHAARARVQMRRVRADGERLRTRLEEERQAEPHWRVRAKKLAAKDEPKALECLRRAKRSAERATELEARVAEHEQIESQLGRDLARVEENLAQLRSKRNLMRTRQSRAEALAAVGACEDGGGLDDVFDRWDTRITEREFAVDCVGDDDRFDHELGEAEFEAELQDELAELVAESDSD